MKKEIIPQQGSYKILGMCVVLQGLGATSLTPLID